MISSDDHFKATLNGKEMPAPGMAGSRFHAVDLTSQIKNGMNDIVIEGMNDAGKAAVAAIIKIRFVNRPRSTEGLRPTALGSRQSTSATPGFRAPSLVVGPVGMAPWGKPRERPYQTGLRRTWVERNSSLRSTEDRQGSDLHCASALGLYKLYVNDSPVSHDLLKAGLDGLF